MICKVIAYITRKRKTAPRELLVFAHQQLPEVPIQVPAGTVDPGETPEAAVIREIWEESGLSAVRLERQLGVYDWVQAGQVKRQYYFLLEAMTELPDRWQHSVQGQGLDAGLLFSYYWTGIERGFEVHESQRAFLNPVAVPELFQAHL